MSSSISGGRIVYADSLWGNEGHFADSATTRDQLNNVLHYADQYAQVRVCWIPSADPVNDGEEYLTMAAGAANTWTEVGSFGPFPWTLRANGDGYRGRIRIGAAASVGGYDVKLRAVLAPHVDAVAERDRPLNSSAYGADVDHVWETTFSGTTIAWRTGASLENSYTNYVILHRDHARPWTQLVGVKDDASGEPAGIWQTLVSLTVYGSTTNVAANPRLYGAYLAEYMP